jgi:hypothetical protein
MKLLKYLLPVMITAVAFNVPKFLEATVVYTKIEIEPASKEFHNETFVVLPDGLDQFSPQGIVVPKCYLH